MPEADVPYRLCAPCCVNGRCGFHIQLHCAALLTSLEWCGFSAEELVIDTADASIDECADQVIAHLGSIGFIQG